VERGAVRQFRLHRRFGGIGAIAGRQVPTPKPGLKVGLVTAFGIATVAIFRAAQG
jgi:hypothetical protein